MRKTLEKLFSFLRIKVKAAGLEISDEVVRLALFDGKVWKMDAIRLEPGVLMNGAIKNREALITALGALREKLVKKDSGKKMNVVVCMSSVPAYTQIFTLPTVQGEDLAKAVELNLRMASPLDAKDVYSGWQIVGRDENTVRLEILSSFMERKVVDEMADTLFEAGFLAMALESRALALARVLREKGAGVDITKSYLFINIDNSGLDFLIIRHGALYFEYANSWHDLEDEKGEISVVKFEAALASSVRQVTNFYNQHWTEPLSSIILSATALGSEAEKVIALNASLPAARLTLVMGQPVSSEWLVALGCSLRSTGLKAKDREISLLGENSQDRFREEQLLHFMRFWRMVVPVSLGLLVLTFGVADAFLMNTKAQIESRADFNVGGAEATQIKSLEATADGFNGLVSIVGTAEGPLQPKNILLAKLFTFSRENNITIENLSFQSFTAPISLSGTGLGEDGIAAFKSAIENDPEFSAVNLPLTSVQSVGGKVSFSMTFLFTPTSSIP